MLHRQQCGFATLRLTARMHEERVRNCRKRARLMHRLHKTHTSTHLDCARHLALLLLVRAQQLLQP